MLITQPRSKKNQNGPRTSLMGPGGVVWGKKPSTKNLVRLPLLIDWVNRFEKLFQGEKSEVCISASPLRVLKF